MQRIGTSECRRLRSHVLIIAAGVSAMTSCGDSSGPRPGITLSLSAPSLSVPQGELRTVNVTIGRAGGFGSDVTLTIEGLPAAVTASFDPATVPAAATTAVLTVAAAVGAASGVQNLTVRATGTGVADRTVALPLTVVLVPANYVLSVAPGAHDVVPGMPVAFEVSIARSSTFSGAVTLDLVSPPAGVTAIASPHPVTGNTATLVVTTAGTSPPGNHTVTVRGTAQGVTDRTATTTLRIAQPPPPLDVSFRFCATFVPIWAAYQDESGAWVRVNADASHTFTFPVRARAGAAFVTDEGDAYGLDIFYGTATELAALGPVVAGSRCAAGPGPKSLSGTIAGVDAARYAEVVLGPRFAGVTEDNVSYALSEVPTGPLDLVAVRGIESVAELAIDRVILRRGLDLPSGSTIPVLDFGATEAIATSPATLTVNGPATGEDLLIAVGLVTRSDAIVDLTVRFGGGNALTYWSVPEAMLATGERHEAIALSFGGFSLVRLAATTFRAPTAGPLTLGPALPQPSVTGLTSTPYPRHRMAIGFQEEYPTVATALYFQPARTVSVTVTGAYLGSPRLPWQLDLPDLGSAAGFDPAWALQPGVDTDAAGRASNRIAALDIPLGETLRLAEFYGTIGPAGFQAARGATAPWMGGDPRVLRGAVTARLRRGRTGPGR